MVNMNEKNRIGKELKILHIMCLLGFAGSSAQAQSVLTLKQDNFKVTYPADGSVETDKFERIATDLVQSIQKFAYPKVPKEILEKIQTKPIRIEFSKINRGGGFSDVPTGEGELSIQIKQAYLNDPSIRSRVIHEWFHALHFTIHPNEKSWIREGLATLFVYLSSDEVAFPKYPGVGLLDALSASTTPLEYPFDPNRNNSEAYGHVFYYFLYLHRNCGGDPLFWKIASGESTLMGRENLNAALRGSNSDFCSSFETSATKAEIARFHNHVVYEKNRSPEKRYFVVSDFPSARSIPLKPLVDVTSDLNKLKVYQPLLVTKNDAIKIKVASLSGRLRIFSLAQDFPYTVSQEIPKAAETRNVKFLILKTEE